MKRCLLAFALLLCASTAFAVALPITPLWSGLFDNSGQPLAGGYVYFYKSGTNTAKTVWDEAAKRTARTYVTLDGYGRAQVYGDMADGYRYDLVVYDASGPTELYRVYGMEVQSNVAPTSFQPGSLDTTRASIASLTVTQRANMASTTINVFHLSNGTLIQSDLTNVDIASASLANTFLYDSLDANSFAVENVATPSAKMDAARKYETDLLASSVADLTASTASSVATLTATLASQAASITSIGDAMKYHYSDTPSLNTYGEVLATGVRTIVDSVSYTNNTDATQTILMFAHVTLQSTASSTGTAGTGLQAVAYLADSASDYLAGGPIQADGSVYAGLAVKSGTTLFAFTHLAPHTAGVFRVDVTADICCYVLGNSARPSMGMLKLLVF